MKHRLRAAAMAAGALLCFGASQAFADNSFTDLGADDGGSWFLGYRLQLTKSFDEIRVKITNSTNFVSGNMVRLATGPQATYSIFTTASTAFAEVPPFPVTFPNLHDFSTVPVAAGPTWHQFQPGSTTTFAKAKGALTKDLSFWLHVGPTNQSALSGQFDGARFTLEAYKGGQLVAKAGGYHKKTGATTADELSFLEVVPVPAALWTGLPMLGGMILLIRRNRRNVLS